MTRQPRPLLNKRRAARFAAVQALYQGDLNGQPADQVVQEFVDYRLDEVLASYDAEISSPKVDIDWFRLVVIGVAEAGARLDQALEGCLGAGWTLARCGYLLRATLRAGAFELAERGDVPPKVVINEYVEIAHMFFSGEEPGFVNAVLDRLVPVLRPAGAVP